MVTLDAAVFVESENGQQVPSEQKNTIVVVVAVGGAERELRERDAEPNIHMQKRARLVVLVGEGTGQNLLDECFVVDHVLAVLHALHHLVHFVRR